MTKEMNDDVISVDWTDKSGKKISLHSQMTLQNITAAVDLGVLKKALWMSDQDFHVLQREVNRAHAAERVEEKGNILFMDHSVHRSEGEIVKIVIQSLYVYSKYLEHHVYLSGNSEGDQL